MDWEEIARKRVAEAEELAEYLRRLEMLAGKIKETRKERENARDKHHEAREGALRAAIEYRDLVETAHMANRTRYNETHKEFVQAVKNSIANGAKEFIDYRILAGCKKCQ